jgi:tetratricopeptide (TPR) repeat protein
MQGPDPAKALPLLDAIRGLDPENPEAKRLAARLMAERGFPQTAFVEAQALASANPGSPMIVELLLDLAEPAGRAAERLRLLEQSLAFHFDDPAAHETLARAALARGDKERFLREAEILERLAPFDGNTLRLVARLAEGASERSLAERLLTARTEIAPGCAAAWKELGLYRMRDGQVDAGVEALEKALSLAPADPWLADHLSYRKPSRPFYLPFAVSPEEYLKNRGRTKAGANANFLVDQTVVRVHETGLASRYTQIVVEIGSREAARNCSGLPAAR